ncbi:hypothetical protein AVEN_155233-1 [Araneus ventricosus]|uniref:Uncharacterized protein n=1 Tax=Araneus ventricosus TaxID=182803 RepID=A0A4Y2JPP1_ARAVE|nr:hypothetical protein AVEN_155233-1 [Araneus ventricosus]
MAYSEKKYVGKKDETLNMFTKTFKSVWKGNTRMRGACDYLVGSKKLISDWLLLAPPRGKPLRITSCSTSKQIVLPKSTTNSHVNNLKAFASLIAITPFAYQVFLNTSSCAPPIDWKFETAALETHS